MWLFIAGPYTFIYKCIKNAMRTYNEYTYSMMSLFFISDFK